MKIKFRKEIYPKDAVQKAMEIYKDFANFTLKSTKNYLVLEIKKVNPKFKSIFKDEFCNHVLGLIKK